MELKPFTSYVCPIGVGRVGHSSLYTGDGSHRRPSDEVCICGKEMVEESSLQDGYCYCLTFESIDPWQADWMTQQYGKDVWKRLTPSEWESLHWYPAVKREANTLPEIQAQYERLSAQAASHEQPVRNVRLERAVAKQWEPISLG